MRPVYLDHHATTPLDPEALDAMMPFLRGEFGNAASRTHAYGWRAAEAVESARARVAAAIGGEAREIVFTSGATEANNLAILGFAEANADRGRHVVTAATEHTSVLDPCRELRARGFDVGVLPVDSDGRLSPEDVARSLKPETILVTLALANNEIGTLHPIAAIAMAARERGIACHCDASQAVGKVPVDVRRLGVDLLSFTAHKLYGPKGVGALWVRRATPRLALAPLLFGGGHEKGLRPGTPNVPGAVGFGVAAEKAAGRVFEESLRIGSLRDRLERSILGRLPGVVRNGHPAERLPGNANLSFEGVTAEAVMEGMRDEVAVSSGSACSSASVSASHVLLAIGRDERLAHASIRFGVGRQNTEKDIDRAADAVVREVTRLRAAEPARTAERPADRRIIEWSR